MHLPVLAWCTRSTLPAARMTAVAVMCRSGAPDDAERRPLAERVHRRRLARLLVTAADAVMAGQPSPVEGSHRGHTGPSARRTTLSTRLRQACHVVGVADVRYVEVAAPGSDHACTRASCSEAWCNGRVFIATTTLLGVSLPSCRYQRCGGTYVASVV